MIVSKLQVHAQQQNDSISLKTVNKLRTQRQFRILPTSRLVSFFHSHFSSVRVLLLRSPVVLYPAQLSKESCSSFATGGSADLKR